jgi:Reverse transcriptase (RNA-dependent DNA polymerase)
VFIKRIKEMYKDTGKSILVNGVRTRQYKVKKGVHQGDLMLCLLYNFVIEPLTNLIRLAELKGIELKGGTERILVNLFADNTLVYPSEDDDIKVTA